MPTEQPVSSEDRIGEKRSIAMAKFFIHRPVFAIVISLIILIAGGISIGTLPVAQYPQISPPTVEVEINYPGANAETVEQSIATNVEAEVNGAENMIYMSSKSSSDGRYVLTCTFKVGANLDLANVDINNRVNKATAKLPQEAIAYGISVKKKSPDILLAISVYSPDSTFDETFLSNFTSINLVDPIARTPGVGSTMIVGQRDYAMRFWVRPDKLAKLGLTGTDLANVIGEQNLVAPAGQVGQPPAKAGTQFQYTVNVKGRLTDPSEFENMIVRTLPDGSILQDEGCLARRTLRQELHQLRPQGRHPRNRPDHLSAPRRQRHSDRGERAEAAGRIQQELSRRGCKYRISLDTTKFVEVAIHEVFLALRDAIILVLIVVFIFLGNFRATFIPMLAVPVSLVGTFAAFVALGFSINTLTMLAVVLAVGIVVDDAIVVVEAVEHHIEHGLSPLRGHRKGDGRGQRARGGDRPRAVRRVRARLVHGRHRRPVVPAVRHHDLDFGDPVGDRRPDAHARAVQHDAAAAQGDPRSGRRVPARFQQGVQQDHRRLSRRRGLLPAAGGRSAWPALPVSGSERAAC